MNDPQTPGKRCRLESQVNGSAASPGQPTATGSVEATSQSPSQPLPSDANPAGSDLLPFPFPNGGTDHDASAAGAPSSTGEIPPSATYAGFVDLSQIPVSLLFSTEPLAESILQHATFEQLTRLEQTIRKVCRYKSPGRRAKSFSVNIPSSFPTPAGDAGAIPLVPLVTDLVNPSSVSVDLNNMSLAVELSSGQNTPLGQKRKASELGDNVNTALQETLSNRLLAQAASQHGSLGPSSLDSASNTTSFATPNASHSPECTPLPTHQPSTSTAASTAPMDRDSSAGAINDSGIFGDSGSGDDGSYHITLTTGAPIKEKVIDGVQWIQFAYTSKGVTTEYTIRADIEAINIDDLDEEFKRKIAIYPRAYVPYSEYKGNRWHYETECNRLAWCLAHLNPKLADERRGVIQRAVDSYRNRRPDLKSRRVMRQEKLNNGTLRKRSSSKDMYSHAQGLGTLPKGGSPGHFMPLGGGVAPMMMGHHHPGLSPTHLNPAAAYLTPPTLNRFNRKKSASLSVHPSAVGHQGAMLSHMGSAPYNHFSPLNPSIAHRRSGSAAGGFPLSLHSNPATPGLVSASHNSTLHFSPGLPIPFALTASGGVISPATGSPLAAHPPEHAAYLQPSSLFPHSPNPSVSLQNTRSAEGPTPSHRRRATMVEQVPMVLHHFGSEPVLNTSQAMSATTSQGVQLSNKMIHRFVDTRGRAHSMTSLHGNGGAMVNVLPAVAEDGTPAAQGTAATGDMSIMRSQSLGGHGALASESTGTGPTNHAVLANPTAHPSVQQVEINVNGQSINLTLRMDTQSVPSEILDAEFKQVNSVYPEALSSASGADSAMGTPTDLKSDDAEDPSLTDNKKLANEVGWRLVALNQQLLHGNRELIAAAVMAYQNFHNGLSHPSGDGSAPMVSHGNGMGASVSMNGDSLKSEQPMPAFSDHSCPPLQTSLSASHAMGATTVTDTPLTVEQSSSDSQAPGTHMRALLQSRNSFFPSPSSAPGSNAFMGSAELQDLMKNQDPSLSQLNSAHPQLYGMGHDVGAMDMAGSHGPSSGSNADMELDYYVHTLQQGQTS
ncbi:hypothetical protein H4R35_006522 [Dimargaris xerosporica]|nr:hypothetical protein H4R35_006522 [Dimargaris xerosporica]